MRKRKIYFGLLLTALGSSALWPNLQAKCIYDSSHRQSKISSVMMTDDRSIDSATGQKKVEKESPFACNMLALDAEGRRRHVAVWDRCARR